jgi:cell wall-associated NlpC family hydrolase
MRRPHPLAALALLSLASLATTACGTPSRTLPRSALVDRARDFRDPPPSPRGRQALSFAAAQIGRRYCWGGTGPSCFDCSGLVQTAWRTAGISLPRTSTAMGSALSDVPLDEVRPGDVLWWPGHVAIYAGNGLEIEALDSRHGVVERPAATPYRALRPE